MNQDELQTQLLQEAVRWLRFQSIEKARGSVETHLDTDQKKTAFEMTNGENSVRAIGATIGVSHVTISNWWGAWFSAGILFKQEGTYKKLFSLSDLGIQSNGFSGKRNGEAVPAINEKRKK